MEGGRQTAVGRWRLAGDVTITVGYDDTTPFGSPIGPKPEQMTQLVFAPLVAHAEQFGARSLVASADALMEQVRESPLFREVARPTADGWELCPHVLYPDAALARPTTLTFTGARSGGRLEATIPHSYWPQVQRLVAWLSRTHEGDDGVTFDGNLQGMLDALREQGLVVDAEPNAMAVEPGILFVGHNTAVVRSATSSVITDPFLFATSDDYPAAYQPLQLDQLGPIDAVLITHSHPDHFDPGTLLRFPSNTQMVVPHVDRETILGVDMATRLRELGFHNIVETNWGDHVRVGDIDVHVLPFYGEQPSDGPVLHAEVRNHGNTYEVRTPQTSAVFLADSGRDWSGAMHAVATEARKQRGPIDYAFCGYRRWDPLESTCRHASLSIL